MLQATLILGARSILERSDRNGPRSETSPGDCLLRCAECAEIVRLTASGRAGSCASCGLTRLAPSDVPLCTPVGRPVDSAAPLGDTGEYLCFADGGQVVVVRLAGERTRIGRDLMADVRFDDPTVSRRHALVVRDADGVRVLDDRSLNGLYVNGRIVETKRLAHGDEIRIGRSRLYYSTRKPIAAEAPASHPDRFR